MFLWTKNTDATIKQILFCDLWQIYSSKDFQSSLGLSSKSVNQLHAKWITTFTNKKGKQISMTKLSYLLNYLTDVMVL